MADRSRLSGPGDRPVASRSVPTGFVDLRSDTVTQPTAEMRRAMAEAEVGDDQYGEDPTVTALEEAYAERVGKAAALFTPSGVMANQIALRVLCRPGALVLAGRRQHVVIYEDGAAALNAGIQFSALDDEDGTLDPAAISWARDAVDHHQPRPELVCVEQTHMPAGGIPWTVPALEDLAWAAGDLPIHMDGARLFNAEVATGTAAAAFTGPVTTVMTCLSKGLCAPVGSVLAGPAEVIAARPGGAAPAGGSHASGRGHRRRRSGRAPDHGRAAGRGPCAGPAGWPKRWPPAGRLRAVIRTGSPPTWSSSATPTRRRSFRPCGPKASWPEPSRPGWSGSSPTTMSTTPVSRRP